MKNLEPYIGVCDFMSRDQVLEMLKVIKPYEHAHIKLMIGTMTSYKVLYGKETKWSKIFPEPEDLKKIFSVSDPLLINCIHYADYENNPNLEHALEYLVGICGPNLNAIQLDMVWPNSHELEIFKRNYDLSLILQISKKAMVECHDNPNLVAKKIRNEYRGLISTVLLDCSMGRGVLIDVLEIEEYIKTIKKYAGDVEIDIAGGLGPDTIYKVQDLIRKYRVSIDAQSKLRLSGKSEDPIDWELARRYIHKAIGYYL